MRQRAFPPVSPWTAAALDGLAILCFTIVGVVSHRGVLPPAALAEDALPLLGGWFAAALGFGLFACRTLRALLLTWAVGIPLGVLVRAAALGRLDEPRQLAFLVTTLVLSLVLVLAARPSSRWRSGATDGDTSSRSGPLPEPSGAGCRHGGIRLERPVVDDAPGRRTAGPRPIAVPSAATTFRR